MKSIKVLSVVAAGIGVMAAVVTFVVHGALSSSGRAAVTPIAGAVPLIDATASPALSSTSSAGSPSAPPSASRSSATPSPVKTAGPRPGGRPGRANTGVPPGKSLTVHQGDLTITTSGTVIDALDIRGFVSVKAANVTIRNSIIRGAATTKQRSLVTSTPGTASVTIEDSELFAAVPSGWIDGLRGGDITARRLNIHDVIDTVHIYGDNVSISASWLHDNLHYEHDPAWNGGASHDDSIQIQQGTHIRILGNTIEGAFNTGIQFTQDLGAVSDVQIRGNWADGGGCTINLAEKGRGPFQKIVITDNVFGRHTKVSNCAIIAPTTTVLTVARNYFTDGAVAGVHKGA